MALKHMVDALNAKLGSPIRKLVLVKLADQANDEGICFPSYQHVADQCEISRRSVIDHINALESLNYLTISRRKNPDKPGENSSNAYKLHILKGQQIVKGGSENAALPPSEPNSPPSENHSPPPGEPAAPGSESPAPRGSEPAAPINTHSFETPNESTPTTNNTVREEIDLPSKPWAPSQQIIEAVIFQGVNPDYAKSRNTHLEFYLYWHKLRGRPVEELDHLFLRTAKRGFVVSETDKARMKHWIDRAVVQTLDDRLIDLREGVDQ